MGIWDPWVQPFKDLVGDAGKLLDSLGDQVLGIPHATKSLGDVLSFDREKFRLAAQLASTEEKNFGALRLTRPSSRRSSASPGASSKTPPRRRSSNWSNATASGGGPTKRSSACASTP